MRPELRYVNLSESRLIGKELDYFVLCDVTARARNPTRRIV
jgi:hypothetical protein